MSITAVGFIVAAIIVMVLAGVAIHLQYRVFQLEKKRKSDQLYQQDLNQQQRERINKSIQLLAHALQGDELSLTEASIRISVLLDSLEVADNIREEFSAFYQLRELTAHIPILEAWKQLDRKQQVLFDGQRLQHEETYRDFVLAAAKEIRDRHF